MKIKIAALVLTIALVGAIRIVIRVPGQNEEEELLDGNGLGQVSGLVHVAAPSDGDVIGD